MRIIAKGATSKSIYVVILDSTSTAGGRKTGLVFNTSSLTAYYTLNQGSATAITLATLAAANSAYSSGGFKEVDATNQPGVYRLDVPNAALTGADSVVITLKGATGMVQVDEEIQLTGVDFMDAVRAGMTALPNANAEAAGGLYTRGPGAGQINQPANGQIDVNTVKVSGTAQTARDLGASVLLSAGTGTGQLDFTSGVVKANLAQILGTALTETAGQIAAAFKQFFNIASPTSTMNLITGVTTATNLTNAPTAGDLTATMKTSVTTAATAATPAAASVTGSVGSVASGGINRASFAADTGLQSVRSNTAQAGAAGTLTLDASASAVNDFYTNCILYLTGGTGVGQARFITAYNGTTKIATANSNWKTTPDNTTTFAVMDFDAIPGATAPTAAQVATAVWQDLLAGADFGTASSIGALLKLDIDGTISSRLASASISLSGGAVTVGTNNDKTGYGLSAAAVQAVWDALTSALTTVGSIGKRIADFLTGDAYVRLGAPAGASTSADIAAAKADTAAIKAKTDSLTFTVAGMADANVVDWKGATAPAMTGDAFARLGAPSGASIAADIQTRLPTSSYTAPLSAAATANAVWNEATAGHSTAGTTGKALTDAGAAGTPLDAAGVRAAVGLASANLDTQLAATAQDSTVAKDATVAKASAISALNNISATDVRTQAKGALADYGAIL